MPGVPDLNDPERRRGTVLIVVMGLLLLLMLLGFFFYTFASQEQGNAEYFAQAAKKPEVGLSPDELFDWSIKQIILGAPDQYVNGTNPINLRNSALWGGRHSLLGTMYGSDVHPHNGQGLNVVDAGVLSTGTPNGVASIDQNRDGTPDNVGFLNYFDGYAGNGTRRDFTNTPQPDVDYTSPDLNNTFLAFNGLVMDQNNRLVRVVIPSFHRPQFLRDTTGLPQRNWYRPLPPPMGGLGLGRKTMRAHPDHRVIDASGAPQGPRYSNNTANPEGAFPFTRIVNGGPDNPEGVGDQGVWDMFPWQANFTYGEGQWVTPTNPSSPKPIFYRAEDPGGMSGGMEPAWPPPSAMNPNPTVDDGTVVWKAYEQPLYDFDADPDGDNINEAVYVDLGFPAQEVDGKFIVPLFAMTIYDADALMNLNAHGNLSGRMSLTDGREFGYDLGPDGRPGVAFVDDDMNGTTDDPTEVGFAGSDDGLMSVSRSNQAHSSHAVNPTWALNARPQADNADPPNWQDDFEQHNYFLNRYPTTASYLEAANIEWFFLTEGRLQLQSPTVATDAFPGRHGELNRLQAGFSSRNLADFPRPGRATVDDNQNLLVGEGAGGLKPFVQPLDFAGKGLDYGFVGGNSALGLRPRAFRSGQYNRWLSFDNYSSRGAVLWGTPGAAGFAGGQLMTTAFNQSYATAGYTNHLLDESFEFVPEVKSASSFDAPFAPSENAYLQLVKSDVINAGVASRAARLAEYNFDRNTRAYEIRKSFTTESWDTRGYGVNWYDAGGAGDVRRRWEWTDLGPPAAGGNNVYEFPPFGDDDDAFREATRRFLRVRAQNQSEQPEYRRQHRLHLNRLVYLENPGNPDEQPKLRDLTEHPADPGRNPVPAGPPAAASYPPTTDAERERWARYDRQLMARDVYTMLYLFGGGRDDLDYATTPNTIITAAGPTQGRGTVYNESQLEEMARFAINYVNNLDRDDVVDFFEYDVNLADGWNLDDDAFTNDAGVADRRIVAGVERQTLTLSEGLIVQAKQVENMLTGIAQNHDATEYDDAQHRDFSYIEFRNAAPHRVQFDDDAWQIVIEDDAPPAGVPRVTPRHLTLLANAGQVDAGGLFSIGTAGDADNIDPMTTMVRPSYMRVDPNWDSMNPGTINLQRIIPATTGSLTIDLVTGAGNNEYRLSEAPGMGQSGDGPTLATNTTSDPGVGDFLKLVDPDTADASLKIRLTLRRRAHPTRTPPQTYEAGPVAHQQQSTDNPWVEVDRMVVDLSVFQLTDQSDVDSSPTIPSQLRLLRGRERPEPLDRNKEALFNPPANVSNSIGANNANSDSTNGFQLYQAHTDRDYHSPIELVTIPLYGPDEVTRWTTAANLTPIAQYDETNTAASSLLTPARVDNSDGTGRPRPVTAGTLFLQPEHSENISRMGPSKVAKHDNRWFRLFEFVEVPTRSTTYDSLLYRTPGRINWNTLRNPAVLAGLLDDSGTVSMQIAPTANPGTGGRRAHLLTRDGADNAPASAGHPILGSLAGERRDYWAEFIRSRDGVDPLTTMYLPGTTQSRPFRSFAYAANGVNSLDDTMLRTLPHDGFQAAAGQDPRKLFELGRHNLHGDNGYRHRLMAKIFNNSTTRSNVFFVFVQVDYFEADDSASPGNYRIGRKDPDSPGFRGFFVLDRSIAFDPANGVKKEHFRPASDFARFSIRGNDDQVDGNGNPVGPGFDWRQMILHRVQLE